MTSPPLNLPHLKRYDGGYGQAPRLESQGGTTYCALAALSLLNSLADAQSNEEAVDTTKWLVSRQTEFFDQASDDTDSEPETLDNGSHFATASELAANQNRDEVDTPCVQHLIAGFQGRPGKALDACYSFWCTAALKVGRTEIKKQRLQSQAVCVFLTDLRVFGDGLLDHSDPPSVCFH